MNFRGKSADRPDNSEKFETYIRDTEHTMLLNVNDHHGNRFLGHWNKLFQLQSMLNWEEQEKLFMVPNARYSARLEIG